MKPPKPIALALPLPPPADPDADADTDGDDVDLPGSDFPTVFLPSGPTYPDFLAPGFEGDVTFHVKVASADEDGIQLDLMSLSATPPAPSKPSADRAGVNQAWDDAETASTP